MLGDHVINNLDLGTEFRFCLPGKIISGGEDRTPKKASENPEHSPGMQHSEIGKFLRKCDVYVIEDSELIRKTLITKLKKVAASSQCEWSFIEHATVESVLPFLADFVDRNDVIITVTAFYRPSALTMALDCSQVDEVRTS